MANQECNLADFVDCINICPDISDDSRLEALRAKLKRETEKDQTEAQNEPGEAQSSLRLFPDQESNEIDNAATTGSLPLPDRPLTVTATAPRQPKRRQPRISAQAWMPPGWKMIAKVRKNGRTAGYIDKFYIGPTGRRCRSKKEALQYINGMNI